MAAEDKEAVVLHDDETIMVLFKPPGKDESFDTLLLWPLP
jgi:hypothetical protein